jgi:hypothetical protein
MTDPGLNHRLRQRSRRAGIMIGISMALTIAVCVGSFSVIYASLDDFFGDFVARGETIPPPPTRAAEPTAAAQEAAQAQPTAAAKPTVAPTPKPTAAPTPTPASDAFEPDYQLNSSGSVNFRSGPGREFEPIGVITPEQPLQYLDEDAPTENPAEDGDRWMKFRTEDGEEGWIREIDVSEYVP